jgi:hypothetical protein
VSKAKLKNSSALIFSFAFIIPSFLFVTTDVFVLGGAAHTEFIISSPFSFISLIVFFPFSSNSLKSFIGSYKYYGDYAKSFSILNRKNFTSITPL